MHMKTDIKSKVIPKKRDFKPQTPCFRALVRDKHIISRPLCNNSLQLPTESSGCNSLTKQPQCIEIRKTWDPEITVVTIHTKTLEKAHSSLLTLKTIPHALPNLLLERGRILPPLLRRLNICRAFIIRIRKHADHAQ